MCEEVKLFCPCMLRPMSEQQQIIILPLAYTVIDRPIKGHPLAALCKSNVARCNMDVSDGEAPLPPHLQGYPAEYFASNIDEKDENI